MSRLFSCLGDLLDHYGRASPGRDAISGPGSASMTYEVLRAYAKDTIRALRSVGIGQSDRVAVALPDGPETAAAIILVASGAVCASLNPSFMADEWRRYLAELRVAALLGQPHGRIWARHTGARSDAAAGRVRPASQIANPKAVW